MVQQYPIERRLNSRKADLLAITYAKLEPVVPKAAVGRKVIAVVMMSIAIAIALTLVWHIAEAEYRIEYRRSFYDSTNNEKVLLRKPHAASSRSAVEDTLVKWDKTSERDEEIVLPPKPNLAHILGHERQDPDGGDLDVPEPDLYEAPKEPLETIEEHLSLRVDGDEDDNELTRMLIENADDDVGIRSSSITALQYHHTSKIE